MFCKLQELPQRWLHRLPIEEAVAMAAARLKRENLKIRKQVSPCLGDLDDPVVDATLDEQREVVPLRTRDHHPGIGQFSCQLVQLRGEVLRSGHHGIRLHSRIVDIEHIPVIAD